jgi:hypothetical protein
MTETSGTCQQVRQAPARFQAPRHREEHENLAAAPVAADAMVPPIRAEAALSRAPRTAGSTTADSSRKAAPTALDRWSKVTPMSLATALASLSASLLASAFTIARWGATEAVYGALPVLVALASAGLFLATLVCVAWITRAWGLRNAVLGASPWLVTAAAVLVALAALAYLGTLLEERGATGPLYTVTCLLVLVRLTSAAGRALRAHLWGERAATRGAPNQPPRTATGKQESPRACGPNVRPTESPDAQDARSAALRPVHHHPSPDKGDSSCRN